MRILTVYLAHIWHVNCMHHYVLNASPSKWALIIAKHCCQRFNKIPYCEILYKIFYPYLILSLNSCQIFGSAINRSLRCLAWQPFSDFLTKVLLEQVKNELYLFYSGLHNIEPEIRGKTRRKIAKEISRIPGIGISRLQNSKQFFITEIFDFSDFFFPVI